MWSNRARCTRFEAVPAVRESVRVLSYLLLCSVGHYVDEVPRFRAQHVRHALPRDL